LLRRLAWSLAGARPSTTLGDARNFGGSDATPWSFTYPATLARLRHPPRIIRGRWAESRAPPRRRLRANVWPALLPAPAGQWDRARLPGSKGGETASSFPQDSLGEPSRAIRCPVRKERFQEESSRKRCWRRWNSRPR